MMALSILPMDIEQLQLSSLNKELAEALKRVKDLQAVTTQPITPEQKQSSSFQWLKRVDLLTFSEPNLLQSIEPESFQLTRCSALF